MKSTTIRLTDGSNIKLTFNELPDEILADRILFTDYSNIAAEIATLPVLLNKIGMMLSDCEKSVRVAELKLKRWKAKKREETRKAEIKRKGKFTIDVVDDAYRAHPEYVILNTRWIEALRQRDDVNSLFWSLKGKSKTLENLSATISVGDFESGLVKSSMKTINYVDIQHKQPLIR